VALEEPISLQKALSGKIGVIAFSDDAQFIPGGVPPFLADGTDLAAALRFAKVADVLDMRFFVISDGQPDDEAEAMAAAKMFTNRIETIFVGPERDSGARTFLEQLAAASGGESVTADRVMELAERIETLLLGGAR
jgi:Mg-chelatase subunit ChlD